jgi:hypothetical protein
MPLHGFRLTEEGAGEHLAEQPVLEVLRLGIPDGAIDAAIAEAGAQEQRRRLLPARLVVAFVIGLGLWAREGMVDVLTNLVDGLRERDPGLWHGWRVPAKSALSQARQRLGPRPLVLLFRRLAGPVATAETPGAFLFGLRLMAIDGTGLETPDTPENAARFGRPTTRRQGQRQLGAYPLVRLVWLVEVGTHVLCDLIARPYRDGEAPIARRLLRSVGAGMLVLWDRGLHSHAMLRRTLDQGAQFLGRVSAPVRLPPEELLADGTFLTSIYPSETARRRRADGIAVRVIEYRIDDPARPGRGERYRLITSLLDPTRYPAAILATEYHQRWEVETALHEGKVQQLDRRPAPHLRSRHPREVFQEVYGVALAHLAVRLTMAEAAARAGLDPDRLSFSGTLRILRRALPRSQRLLADPARAPLFSTPSSLTSRPAPTHRVGTAPIPASSSAKCPPSTAAAPTTLAHPGPALSSRPYA